MNLDGALSLIHEDLPRLPWREASHRLAEYIYAHHEEIKHLSYTRIAQIIESNDPATLIGVTQYCAGDRLGLLKMKFELIIEDESTELEDEDVFSAEQTGYLIHPETGEPIPGYERHVYPFFIPGKAVTHND
ncbi:hypothetical protein [Stutzerimonas xanthomarina]|uniref:hypothetical protein n=1 Tax=Stutzerimonas xanthomarina TaxID=271420 RepID=UPI003AA87D81